jgi:hypothetical protein
LVCRSPHRRPLRSVARRVTRQTADQQAPSPCFSNARPHAARTDADRPEPRRTPSRNIEIAWDGTLGRELSECDRRGSCLSGRQRGSNPTPSVLLMMAILKQTHNRAEKGNTVAIEDRWYMRRTPPPSRPPPPSQPPVRPSSQPLPRRRTGAGVRLLIVALVGIVLILAAALASVEAQRCREGLQAPVCRI